MRVEVAWRLAAGGWRLATHNSQLNRPALRVLLALTLCAAFVSCGGGSGNADAPPAVAPPPATATLELLQGQRWTHVVLQAQKYSSSGQFQYSTTEALALIRLARAAGAQAILFPEWPRRGIDESARIYELHVSIAQREPACVAPIGQAFDLAALRQPALLLHNADGNHSAPAGAFLAALMLYGSMPPSAATHR